MPTSKSIRNEKGIAPVFLILTLALIMTAGLSAKIKTTHDFPREDVQVLGDTNEATKSAMKYTEDEIKKYKELQAKELKLKKELYQKEIQRAKDSVIAEQEKTKIELERKQELLKKQQELRKKAGMLKSPAPATPAAEAEISDEEIKKLTTQLESLQLTLNKKSDDSVLMEQQLGELKLKYKYENGKLEVKAQAENGSEIEVDDPQVNVLKAQLEQNLKSGKGIGIATESSKIFIGKNKIKAKTDDTVSVDPLTGALSISTKKGVKQVTILPDVAVQNLIAKNLMTEVAFDPTLQDTTEKSVIELQNRNDELVYKIQGKKTKKLLGLIPVSTENTAFVSAENGNVVSSEESVFASFLNYISF